MSRGPTIIPELRMVRRLRRLDLFAGVTTAAERRERVRAAIVAGDPLDADGVPWADLFHRVYGESLRGGDA